MTLANAWRQSGSFDTPGITKGPPYVWIRRPVLFRPPRHVRAPRDRVGIKPLFYALHEGQLYFASEVKALFARGVPARWDLETVHHFHATWLLPPHRTLYQNVYQVPPGHYLLASAENGFASPR